MSSTRSPQQSAPLALRLLAIAATVAVVIAGLWITGALITNDFGVAMWLTVAWMALAGCAALAVAARSHSFRWPVLGAYVVTAAAAGAYLGSSVLVDDVVHEQVATAPAVSPPAGGQEPRRAEPRNARLRIGRFESVRHPATGVATAIRLARGGRVLTLTDFEVDNGPDLRLYLVAGPGRSEDEVRDYVDLGALKGNRGDQQYRLPAGLDLDRYSTAVIWCRAFSVLFARAPTARDAAHEPVRAPFQSRNGSRSAATARSSPARARPASPSSVHRHVRRAPTFPHAASCVICAIRPMMDRRELAVDIEDALVAHWSRFGLWRRGKLHDEVSLYRRAAFVKRSALPIFATAPLWSRSH